MSLLTKGLPFVKQANPYASVGTWIFATASMVVGMVHVGGVTRLTQSGLSMTDWSPLGSLPPMSKEAWEAEFDRYKKFPEYQQRKSMTVQDFKYIYWWEYGHRMLGRTVGVVFTLPWFYFTIRKQIPSGFQKNMAVLFTMGASQGLVGWWMVKSGLGQDRFGEKREIRVQPERLAAHLTMAVATYSALLWTGFDILSIPHVKTLQEQVAKLAPDALQQASRLRLGSFALTALTFTTITSGALVAGNDAGRAYNTWPKMNDDWIPNEIWDDDEPPQRNTALVQFNHRVLASATALTAISLLGYGWRVPLTPQAYKGLMAVGITATGQFALGVTTLLNYAPFELAAAHQLGSLAVMTSSLYLAHSLRYARPALAMIGRAKTSF